jgi:hypothetical protein
MKEKTIKLVSWGDNPRTRFNKSRKSYPMKLAYLGSDYPDYWSGFHRPQIQIPIIGNMTNAQVARAIRDEVNMTYEHYSICDDYTPEEFDRAVIDYILELLEKPDKIAFEGYDDPTKVEELIDHLENLDLPDMDEHIEAIINELETVLLNYVTWYAYFAMVGEPVYRNGIKFVE